MLVFICVFLIYLGFIQKFYFNINKIKEIKLLCCTIHGFILFLLYSVSNYLYFLQWACWIIKYQLCCKRR